MEWGRWGVLVATTWMQALTGTNLDFSAYSTELKSVMQITQLQLSFLSMASDIGKLFGWCSGLSLLYFPIWVVVFLAAALGLGGYGVQWLLISGYVSLPYFLVCILCLLAGCSICWFNTVCFVLCLRNFPSNRSLSLSLSISFNGLTAALYTLIVNSINSNNSSLYLLLNAFIPLLTSILSLIPISYHHHYKPPPTTTTTTSSPLLHPRPNSGGLASFAFLALYSLAVFTGLYVILLTLVSTSTDTITRLVFVGAVLLLFVAPLLILGVVNSGKIKREINARFEDVSFNLVGHLYDEVNKEVVEMGHGVLGRDRISGLGEEHSSRDMVRRWEFWLYYLAYLGGGTIGLAYSNNLGQIVQSLGYKSNTTFFVSMYSTCSFFGRLLAAAPDFLSNKLWFARTGWLAISIVPTPIAFFLLVASGSWVTLCTSTILIGLSSGYVFAASISVTSELFGPHSAGINHNILITNIPIGSVSYGIMAAVIYDWNADGSIMSVSDGVGEEMVCMGRECYLQTFVWFGCISLLGLVCGLLLFVRTKFAYDQFRKSQVRATSLI